MNTPGKNAYQRKSFKSASQPTYSRKKASMSGSDAKSAYTRQKQGPVTAAQIARTANALRQRLSGSSSRSSKSAGTSQGY